MPNSKGKTFFAPPERLAQDKILQQVNALNDSDIFADLLDATPDYLIVLNENRQIVFTNKAFRDLVDNIEPAKIYGLRLGEVLDCQHAFENKSGCGTSEFCRTCGAVNAILSSLRNKEDVQECQIIQSNRNEPLDLRVWAKPISFREKIYSIFTFADISHEKKRTALERIFFHDVLNSASGLKSSLNLLMETTDENKKEIQDLAMIIMDSLIEIIKAQRDLELAETGELDINLGICSPDKLISTTVNLYKHQEICHDKDINIIPNTQGVNFLSDSVLLQRILGNMLKNALEASEKGATVKIGYKLIESSIQFFVHNDGFIQPSIKHQIFHRSFSTKGKGRGLGTYSIKLLTERYLHGKVWFTSNKEGGTTFYVQYPVNFQ